MTDKVVISSREIADVGQPSEGPQALEPKLSAPIPLWVKVTFSGLVIALPLLCVVSVVIRAALRNQPPRTKHAWTAYLCTLLIVSGLVSSIAVIVFLSRTPAPMLGSTALSELDERNSFPTLPSVNPLDGSEVSQQLKPIVMIVSPTVKGLFGERSIPTVGGAGVLIEANENGYLIATAQHVVGASESAMIATSAGIWARAEVIGHHRNLDLALLRISRHSGHANFIQPIAAAKDGEPIYVIGHPQGLRYSLTSGIVSREEGSVVQISAAVSPGNSGGPVYDNHGSLVGIVTSTTDKAANPNAENLNFAVSAEALRDSSAWVFSSKSEKYRSQFQFLK